jgi:SAM-dependent methyltransferase
MNEVFDAYAHYYDLLYRDKDYKAEVAYVASRIRSADSSAHRILDLGCGTGAHAELLAEMGFEVHGVDFSDPMIARANARRDRLPADVAERLSFGVGDICTVKPEGKFDAVVSLFHVMSYLTSGAELQAALATAYDSLVPGGLFFFDFWYGPAVLMQKPEVRVKRLEDDAIRVVRVAEPVVHTARNVVDVGYTVFVERKNSGSISQLREVHPMRYLFLPELEQLVSPQFEWLGAMAWMTSSEPGPTDWAACVMLKRSR